MRYRAIVHQGADHGYALPDRDVYDKAASNRDWEHIFPMLERTLRAWLVQCTGLDAFAGSVF